jgi:hypothetical protein
MRTLKIREVKQSASGSCDAGEPGQPKSALKAQFTKDGSNQGTEANYLQIKIVFTHHVRHNIIYNTFPPNSCHEGRPVCLAILGHVCLFTLKALKLQEYFHIRQTTIS